MPLRPLNREQTWLLPPTLDELVPADHPARFMAEVVDGLERTTWSEMGVDIEGKPLGSPAYHPRGLLSVWLYGFMTGVRSSRKLEAACRDQIPYLWLTGWQRPDHNTLWRFYRDHRRAMRTLLKRTVHTAVGMGLVDMAVQAVDGTKVMANAATACPLLQGALEDLMRDSMRPPSEREFLPRNTPRCKPRPEDTPNHGNNFRGVGDGARLVDGSHVGSTIAS